jgi:hypothetical protein
MGFQEIFENMDDAAKAIAEAYPTNLGVPGNKHVYLWDWATQTYKCIDCDDVRNWNNEKVV